MENIRVIKRYPNRRLYDTEASRYITLDEIKDLIVKHVNIQVIDVSTEEDLTNYVLLQIINENEGSHSPIFTTAMLQNIIRFYGNPMQKALSDFLEKSFSSFTQQYTNFVDNTVNRENPLNIMANLAKQSMEMWQSAHDQYFHRNNAQPINTKKPKKKTAKKSTSKPKKRK